MSSISSISAAVSSDMALPGDGLKKPINSERCDAKGWEPLFYVNKVAEICIALHAARQHTTPPGETRRCVAFAISVADATNACLPKEQYRLSRSEHLCTRYTRSRRYARTRQVTTSQLAVWNQLDFFRLPLHGNLSYRSQ